MIVKFLIIAALILFIAFVIKKTSKKEELNSFEQHCKTCSQCGSQTKDGDISPLCEEGYQLFIESLKE